MRELVLDTETTGLDPRNGDRLVEIGAVEVINYIPTGQSYHAYINPERSMPTEAFDVHGLSEEFLREKPLFCDVVSGFLEFIGSDNLVIHNAAFDMGFINMEMTRVGKEPVQSGQVVDTLQIARKKHPSGPNSLDALCSRYGIDNSRRTKHGALLDAELLAEVYLELMGGRQAGLGLQTVADVSAARDIVSDVAYQARPRPVPIAVRERPEEKLAHSQFIETLGENAIWLKYRQT